MMRIAAHSPIVSGAVADPRVWSPDAARIRVNDVDGIAVRTGLQTGAIDPRWVFAACDGTLETQGPSASLTASMSAVSESGVLGPDSVVRFAKVADPDNAAKRAYLMRRKQGDELTIKRTELSFSTTFTPVPRGSVCWIGFATRLPEVFRTMTGTDEVMIFQVHETPDAGDDTQGAPIGMVVRGPRQMMWVQSNPNATTLAAATTYTEVFSETVWPGDQWQFWAVKLRSDWDPASLPRIEAWRRVGASSASVKVVDYAGPNSYNNTVRDYIKSGLYYYSGQWTGGVTEKVLHHKGIYQWMDGHGIDQEAILDHLQSI